MLNLSQTTAVIQSIPGLDLSHESMTRLAAIAEMVSLDRVLPFSRRRSASPSLPDFWGKSPFRKFCTPDPPFSSLRLWCGWLVKFNLVVRQMTCTGLLNLHLKCSNFLRNHWWLVVNPTASWALWSWDAWRILLPLVSWHTGCNCLKSSLATSKSFWFKQFPRQVLYLSNAWTLGYWKRTWMVCRHAEKPSQTSNWYLPGDWSPVQYCGRFGPPTGIWSAKIHYAKMHNFISDVPAELVSTASININWLRN